MISVRGITKLYMGAIIESARRIQLEWMEKTGETQCDLPTPPADVMFPPPDWMKKEAGASAPGTKATDGAIATGSAAGGGSSEEKDKDKEEGDKDKEEEAKEPPPKCVGPLRPDHLREAVRRYKLAQEGAGVGTKPLWNIQQQNGAERFPSRTGGRRIFR